MPPSLVKISLEFQWNSSGIHWNSTGREKSSGIPLECHWNFFLPLEFHWKKKHPVEFHWSITGIFFCHWNSTGRKNPLEFHWKFFSGKLFSVKLFSLLFCMTGKNNSTDIPLILGVGFVIMIAS